MTMLRWRAFSTPSKPNSSITSSMQHVRKPGVISLPTSRASTIGHRISQPDRDGAKSSLTLSIFSGEDHNLAIELPSVEGCRPIVRVGKRKSDEAIARLTREQFRVTQQSGTERPGTGPSGKRHDFFFAASA